MAKGKYRQWRTPDGLTLLEGWAKDGLTDEQIAHNMGISRKTLYEWKANYSDICDALKKSKEVADYIVENALYKAATGYKSEETRIEIMPDGKKKAIQITRDVAPNPAAAIFWLKNRRPDKWRDRREAVVVNSISQQAIDDVEDFLNELQTGETPQTAED